MGMITSDNEKILGSRPGAVAAPFLIHDPEKLWLVESGSVDLFLVQTEGEVPMGARHHVLRVKQGKAIFGTTTPSSTSMRLLAAPTPDSCVLEFSRARLQDLSTSPAGKKHATQLLEDWITNFSRAATGDVLPKLFEFLEPGRPPVLKEAKAVLPREGVVWVQLLEGGVRFLGDYELSPVEEHALFPVSASAWLEADKNTKLSAATTADCFERDTLWSGLQDFQAMVMDRLMRNLQLDREKELARLERRGKLDEARLDLAMRLLASPLGPDEEIPTSEEADDDAWLLACLAIGNELDIQFKPHPDRRRGMAQKDPVNAIAHASGVRVRTVALKGNWWTQDAGPLLAQRESDKAPVALLPVSPRRYQLCDPVARTRIAVDEKVAASLEPFAYCFYRPFPPKKLNAVDLVVFGSKGCRGEFVTILLMGIAAGLLGLVMPVITGIIFDSVIPGANRPQLLQVFVLVLVVSACTILFQVAQSFAMLRLEGKMDASVQAAVWDRLLSLPVPFFRDYSAGDLAMRSLSITAMRQVITGMVLSSVFSGIFSIFNFALLFYYSWKLALLATGLTLTGVAATNLAGYLQLRYQRELAKIRGHLSGTLLQFINGISKLRVSGTENRAFAAWAKEFTRQKKISVEARKVSIGLAVFSSIFPVLSSVAIFYALSLLMEQGDTSTLTTGSFLAFNAAYTQFQFAMLGLSSAFVALLSVVPLYERAKPILDALPEVDRAKSYPGELSGNIEVRHVNFRYRPDTPLVLRDVSLKVNAGRFVAIVGPSGSGKSTLFRMLLGFETPESGAIHFDNQDQAHLDIQAVRGQIGVVLQSGKLLSDSIYKNIVGSAPLTMEDAWESARMAGLEKDIRAMPMGMHTVIAEGGGGLSGGQRQRLMIARAIVKKPRILLFDEATSALDNETQAIVSRSLESLQATRIVIAHRLSTIAHADYVYVMDKGVVVQEGTYQELIGREGPFADLAKRQIA